MIVLIQKKRLRFSIGMSISLLMALSSGFPVKVLAEDNYFHTPSKNIWCVYQAGMARLRCDISQRKWKDWGCKQYGCFGPGFILPDIGKARPKEVSDSLIDSSQYSLKYGSSISFGKITCVSETSGLTCRNKTGGYLHINREFYIAK